MPEVFKRCSMAASHPEWAKMEPGVALQRRQKRNPPPLSHPSPVLQPVAHWLSLARLQ